MWDNQSIQEVHKEHLYFEESYRTNRYKCRSEHTLDLAKMKKEYDRRWTLFWKTACEKNVISRRGWEDRINARYSEYLEIKNTLSQWLMIAKLEKR